MPNLVLSRKRNESIVINGDIVIAVAEIRGDKVRLAISAPREVPVDRKEIHDAKARDAMAQVRNQPREGKPQRVA